MTMQDIKKVFVGAYEQETNCSRKSYLFMLVNDMGLYCEEPLPLAETLEYLAYEYQGEAQSYLEGLDTNKNFLVFKDLLEQCGIKMEVKVSASITLI